jgi:hypothetical protein
MGINRIVPDRETLVGPNEHLHECECGTVWAHDEDQAQTDFDEAHACPTCGEEQTFKVKNRQFMERRRAAFDRLFGFLGE